MFHSTTTATFLQMKNCKAAFFLLGLILLLVQPACNKEHSFENGPKASGSIICNTGALHGSYDAGVLLTDSTYLSVQVAFNQPGSYKIYTDTVNGYYFLATGTIASAGITQIRLTAHGRPVADVQTDFLLHFDTSYCSIHILPAQKAAFYQFTGNTCPSFTVQGSYKAGVPLSGDNTVSVAVHVYTPGLYNIHTATVNGISFADSGTFARPGDYIVLLKGIGKPLLGGAITLPLTIDQLTCNIPVAIGYRDIDPGMYYQFTVNGKTYRGYADSAYLGSALLGNNGGVVRTLSLFNLRQPDNDTSFNLVVSRLNTAIVTGDYHSALLGEEDFEGGIMYSTSRKQLFYTSRYMPQFIVHLTTLDAATRKVEGSFSGPALDTDAKEVMVTDGYFISYLAHP